MSRQKRNVILGMRDAQAYVVIGALEGALPALRQLLPGSELVRNLDIQLEELHKLDRQLVSALREDADAIRKADAASTVTAKGKTA